MTKNEIATSPKAQTVQINKMTFPETINPIIEGKSVTRMEWGNSEYYLKLVDGHLKNHKPDGKFYDLIVTDGDMVGDDWMFV